MTLLTPDFGLLFWMLISFGIVFFALVKKGFPVITGMVDKRRDHIEKSLEAADEANRKLEHVREEAQKIVEDAEARHAEMIKKAVAESEQIIQNAQIRAAKKTEKQLEAARQRIENQKSKALAEINSQVAILSCDIAEKVLRHHLRNEDGQDDLVVRLIKEAEELNDSKKNA